MHTDLPELERDFSREGRENDITICDLASENRPYDIFNPNGVISIML